jgi:hypothetical protein
MREISCRLFGCLPRGEAELDILCQGQDQESPLRSADDILHGMLFIMSIDILGNSTILAK